MPIGLTRSSLYRRWRRNRSDQGILYKRYSNRFGQGLGFEDADADAEADADAVAKESELIHGRRVQVGSQAHSLESGTGHIYEK